MPHATSVFGLVALLALIGAGCASPPDEPLPPPTTKDSGTGEGDGGGTGGMGGTAGEPTGGVGGEGGTGATAGTAGAAGMAGIGGGECMPNPDTNNEVCTEICPETCNNEDDDCDRKIDEDSDDDCALPNAVSGCSRGNCVIAGCVGEFRDCDDAIENGCEAQLGTPEFCANCDDQCSFTNAIAACVDSTCEPAGCLDTHADCNVSPENCETPITTLTDCGGCGLTCDNLDQATPTCATGSCAVDTCIGNFGDCNEDAVDGCEQELNTAEHCGKCDMGCAFMGTTSDCASGTCVALGCDPGYADCDGDDSNGCESLDTPQHCGGCGKPCDLTSLAYVTSASCGGQVCTISCMDGHGDCDNDPANGCETSLDSNVNCGFCGAPCAAPNALTDCGTGTCEFLDCQDGWGDCDTDVMTGCEVDLNSTLAHCGGCGDDCPVDKLNCVGGRCSGLVCPAPTADCDGDDVDCDGNLSLLTSCGSCTNACAFNSGLTPTTAHGTLSCAVNGPGYACDVVCAAGYDDCDGNYKNGCEVDLRTLGNCGSCGQGCTIPNATETCSTGVCKVQTCDADWGNCDADPDTCERDLSTTSSCGSCNNSCDLPNANEACTGTAPNRMCTVGSCSSSAYRDCNTTAGDGCEINVSNNNANCGSCGNNCGNLPNVNATSCSGSACQIGSCDAGFGNCTGAPGCETVTTTTTACGSCNNDCTALANTAAVTCNGGTSCGITMCDVGYANCNGTIGDGCETDLYTLANCGGCANMAMNQNCAGLPNVATASCAAGSCAVMACNSGFADCNGVATDGCEHALVDGPCDPDTMCTSMVWPTNGHTYWFCTNARPQSEARSRCTMLARSDLVNIGSAAENAFVEAQLADVFAWIGAGDATRESTWTWASNGVPYWKGQSTGVAVGTNYANWSTGEPNDYNMGNPGEDCVEMRADGKWNDQACSGARAFVCEVSPDECGADPAKWDPGQCGCGVADTDGDGDLFANCQDGCASDVNKQAMGVCGCGNPDTDTDGDTFADCIENCDADPMKQDPGGCGCNVADTDTDGDGTPNCNDQCPNNPSKTVAPCGFSYTPLNFTAASLTFTANVNVNCSVTLTSGAANTAPVSICGTMVTPVVQTQTVGGGPQVWVLPMASLNVASGFTLKLVGTLPVVIAVQGATTIAGTIDAGSTLNTTVGAGGNVSCTTGNAGTGGGPGTIGAGNGGGGGAGFGTAGIVGGAGGIQYWPPYSPGAGGAAGTVEGSNLISPLRGGCRGGNGGAGGQGGAGGGAVQLSVDGTLTLASTGAVTAAGGGGNKGSSETQGGGGGGAGGAVLLEATTLSVNAGAWITANGGGGASGGNGGVGANGLPKSTARAGGGSGDGGNGGGGASLAGATPVQGSAGGIGKGGGGSGGAVGRIRVHGVTAGCTVPTAQISPAALIGCP